MLFPKYIVSAIVKSKTPHDSLSLQEVGKLLDEKDSVVASLFIRLQCLIFFVIKEIVAYLKLLLLVADLQTKQ